MTRMNGDPERAGFRAEDQIDEVFAQATRNPRRIDCPGADALRAAGTKALPMDHPVYQHLTVCSDCYREFQLHQRATRTAARWRPILAIAAGALLAVVGATYVRRNLGVGPWSGMSSGSALQSVLIDYRAVGTTRSEAGDPVHKPLALPRRNLGTTILLPIGSELGEYELRLIDGSGRIRLAHRATATLQDFAARIAVNLDLRSLPRGAYSLQVRRLGEEWDPHPVILQ